jgi:hypothetical protein
VHAVRKNREKLGRDVSSPSPACNRFYVSFGEHSWAPEETKSHTLSHTLFSLSLSLCAIRLSVVRRSTRVRERQQMDVSGWV